jgi:DNA-binding MarR family transcriptional regulator
VAVLEVAPLIMRAIRQEVRKHRGFEMSIPQFRALIFLDRYEGASLSGVASHIGITLPSASKIVDGLVERGLATRRTSADDRRHIELRPTAEGRRRVQAAIRSAQEYLSAILKGLSDSDRKAIVCAMQALRPLFGVEGQKRKMGPSS